MQYRPGALIHRSRSGFTFVELMVVVGIIAILMVAGRVAFSNSQRGARDARRRADIDAYAVASEQFFGDNASAAYPTSAAQLLPYFPTGALPTDPKTPTMSYTQTLSTTGYCWCATMERANTGNSGASCAAGSKAQYCASQRQ